MRVPPPWDREPTGRRRPSDPGMGLKRVPRGRYPCRGGSVEVRPGTGRKAGLGHGTGFKEFDQGFAASWVFLLRHAARPSMARSGADIPVGSRSQEEYPTPCELCEIERGGFNRLPLLTFCIEAASFCCGCNSAEHPVRSLLGRRATGPQEQAGWFLLPLYRAQHRTDQRG